MPICNELNSCGGDLEGSPDIKPSFSDIKPILNDVHSPLLDTKPDLDILKTEPFSGITGDPLLEKCTFFKLKM